MSWLNADVRELQLKAEAFHRLPAIVRGPMLRAGIQSQLTKHNIALAFLMNIARNLLPPDERVEKTFNAFLEEFWRWWRDGGGQ